ncbi:MAG: adenylate kinase [Clostridia bacterium]|nr:adenylate kinase [Clostridia bacterium]
MIVLITGTTHTGKTALAQRLLEKYKFPYLSIDHLKMGLIRSNQTTINVDDDEKLTPYLWAIVKEIIKTAIENSQNLIVEGCYVPFDWEKDFSKEYLSHVKYYCLIMSKNYIQKHFSDILANESVVEQRLTDDLTEEILIKENQNNLQMCKKHKLNYILIDTEYKVDIEL